MKDEVLREVEKFLYMEADDVRYWMPIRPNRYPVNSKAITILDGSRYEEAEISSEEELAFMDEDKDSLTRRIARLDTGMAWAEDPPSRTRHIITNIEVEAGDTEDELRAYSNF